MITITYISKDRPNHLQRSVRSLFSQTVKPEHIVITDCSDDKLSMERAIEELKKESLIPITFIWKPKEELSRSQGRSLGREYVKTKIIVSTESDILFPNNIIEETLRNFENPPKKIYLQFYAYCETEDGIKKETPVYHNNGFFQAYRTEDFDNIGGYNPFLKGWGWEDVDFSERIVRYGCRHIIIPFIYVTHMWHKSVASGETNSSNKNIAENSYWNGDKWVYNSSDVKKSCNEPKSIVKEKINPINSQVAKKNAWASCNKG